MCVNVCVRVICGVVVYTIYALRSNHTRQGSQKSHVQLAADPQIPRLVQICTNCTEVRVACATSHIHYTKDDADKILFGLIFLFSAALVVYGDFCEKALLSLSRFQRSTRGCSWYALVLRVIWTRPTYFLTSGRLQKMPGFSYLWTFLAALAIAIGMLPRVASFEAHECMGYLFCGVFVANSQQQRTNGFSPIYKKKMKRSQNNLQSRPAEGRVFSAVLSSCQIELDQEYRKIHITQITENSQHGFFWVLLLIN